MSMLRTSAACAALMLAATAAPAHSQSAPGKLDPKVLAAAKAAYDGEIKLLGEIVNIDSGTYNVEGGVKIQAILAERLKAAGAVVQLLPAEAPNLPPNLVATVTGKGRGRILMIGHIDTVFEPGEAARRPFRTDSGHAYGPGVMDEKGGVVTGVTAMELIHAMKYKNFDRITLLVETSEEQGSPGTRKLIDNLVHVHDVELNLEPEAKDTVTVWRKSSGTLTLKVTGRAAHAGMEPQAGRNAADELIHQIGKIEATYPRSGDGITVNLTTMKAGTRSNIIPAYAEGVLNVRARTLEDMAAVGATVRELATNTDVPDTTVSVDYDYSFPPLIQNARVTAVADKAKAFAAELGRSLAYGGNGGASESALADAAGTPALDGLGSTGAGAHTPNESLDLDSVTPRLYVLTRLIQTYGERPPVK